MYLAAFLKIIGRLLRLIDFHRFLSMVTRPLLPFQDASYLKWEKFVISYRNGGVAVDHLIRSADINAEGARGVSILVVDCNSACLAIVSKMLYVSGYKVITAKRATDALRILRERQHQLDLILTELHLPDMDKYELLGKIGEISCLPTVIVSADNDENAMLSCLLKGVVFYLVKPITLKDVKNLWQFSCMKNQKENVATEGSHRYHGHPTPEDASNEASECQSVFDTRGQNTQKSKTKELQEIDVSLTVPKKRKLSWTIELHNRFLQAIRILGIDNAHPKKILKHMNVPGLRKENISSHLQKYRLSLKREQDAIQKTIFRDEYYSPWNMEDRGSYEFLKTQFLMRRNHAENQQYLYGSSIPSLSCGNFPFHMQLSSHSDQINTSCNYQSRIRINNNEEMGRFGQINSGFEIIASDGAEPVPLSPLPLLWGDQEEDMVMTLLGLK